MIIYSHNIIAFIMLRLFFPITLTKVEQGREILIILAFGNHRSCAQRDICNTPVRRLIYRLL